MDKHFSIKIRFFEKNSEGEYGAVEDRNGKNVEFNYLFARREYSSSDYRFYSFDFGGDSFFSSLLPLPSVCHLTRSPQVNAILKESGYPFEYEATFRDHLDGSFLYEDSVESGEGQPYTVWYFLDPGLATGFYSNYLMFPGVPQSLLPLSRFYEDSIVHDELSQVWSVGLINIDGDFSGRLYFNNIGTPSWSVTLSVDRENRNRHFRLDFDLSGLIDIDDLERFAADHHFLPAPSTYQPIDRGAFQESLSSADSVIDEESYQSQAEGGEDNKRSPFQFFQNTVESNTERIGELERVYVETGLTQGEPLIPLQEIVRGNIARPHRVQASSEMAQRVEDLVQGTESLNELSVTSSAAFRSSSVGTSSNPLLLAPPPLSRSRRNRGNIVTQSENPVDLSSSTGGTNVTGGLLPLDCARVEGSSLARSLFDRNHSTRSASIRRGRRPQLSVQAAGSVNSDRQLDAFTECFEEDFDGSEYDDKDTDRLIKKDR